MSGLSKSLSRLLNQSLRPKESLTAAERVLALIAGNAYSELWHPTLSTVWTERNSPTTVAGDGDLVGTIEGLNGVSNLVSQADADRATLDDDAGTLQFDIASGDKLGTTTAAAWGSSVTLSVFMGIQTTDTQFILLNKGYDANVFSGYGHPSSTAALMNTIEIDETAVSPSTRVGLSSTLSDNSKHMVRITGVDATGTNYPDIGICDYTTASFVMVGKVGPVMVIPEILLDASAEAKIRAMYQEWGTP